MIYYDHYVELIQQAFERIPDADVIIFNVDSMHGHSAKKKNGKIKRVRWYNCMSYGAIRLCVKREPIQKNKILFNTNFGGGTKFSSGEDSLFIADLLRHHLKIYSYPEFIGIVDDDISKSSWFKGYDKKYYYDKGVFYKTLSSKFAYLLGIQDLIRHPSYKENNLTFMQAYQLLKKGIQNQKDMIPYSNKLGE